MKKIVSVFLSLVMLLSSFPITAYAKNVFTSDNGLYSYSIIYTDDVTGETYIEINGFNGSESSLTVPYIIDDYYVKSIKGAFVDNSNISQLILSEGIECIEEGSFEGCSLSLSLPSSLKYIASQAFYGCELSDVDFGDGLLAIDTEAFIGCYFYGDVILPDSLKYLGMSAFEECYIENAYLGKNVRPASDIEYSFSGDVTDGGAYPYEEYIWNPFYLNECNIDVSVSDDNAYIRLENDLLYTKDNSYLLACYAEPYEEAVDVILPEGLRMINEEIFPEGFNIGRLFISSTVEYIIYQAFCGVTIESLEFAENSSLRIIDNYAFLECGIKGELVLPSSLEEIGEGAFYFNEIDSLDFELPSSCSEIDSLSFADNRNLKSVFIPNSVIQLGGRNTYDESYVFGGCWELESVIFEDNSRLKTWGRGLFFSTNISHLDTGVNNAVERIYGFDSTLNLEVLDLTNCPSLRYCGLFSSTHSLKEVNLSNTSITTIPEKCFYNCSQLEKVTLPETVATIEAQAFEDCVKLREINLDNVINIEQNAFAYCSSLSEPIEERSEMTFGDFKYVKLSEGVAITGYTGNETNLVIPDEIEGVSVTKIANKVFMKSNAETVKLPENLVTIGDSAFYNSSLKQMPRLPDSLVYIGASAFSGMELTGTLVIPDNVTTICINAFFDCKFSEVYLGKSLKTIGAKAFFKIEAEELVIPDSVANLDVTFTKGVKLKSIDFGKSSVDLESFFINDKTFADYFAELEQIKVSLDNQNYSTIDGVLYSKGGARLIYYPIAKPDESFITPDSVKTISTFAFSITAFLKEITIGDSVETIEDQAFLDMHSVERLNISGNVKNIGIQAFAYAQMLKEVVFGDGLNIPRLTEAFYYCTELETVVFGAESSVETMNSTFKLSGVKTVIMPESVVRLDSTFMQAQQIESVILPHSVTAMLNVFSNSGVISVEIPDGISILTDGNFTACPRLTSVKLGNVKSIEGYAFYNCTSLESIDLTGVVYVSDKAFFGCDNLKKLYFTADEEDTYISENEFQGNDTIETIVVGNSVTEIQDYAFADCSELQNAFIADSVTEIADTAFENCDKLSILCTQGSYAMSFAQRMSIPFTTFVVSPISDQLYTGAELTPKLEVNAQSKTLSIGNDYTAVYTDNIDVGSAKVNVIGLGDYSIFACLVRFNIVKKDTPDDVKEPDTPSVQSPIATTPEPDDAQTVTTNEPIVIDNITPDSDSQSTAQKATDSKNSAVDNTADSISKSNEVSTNSISSSQSVAQDNPTTESSDDEKSAESSNESITSFENDKTDNELSEKEEIKKELNWFLKLLNKIKHFIITIISFIKSAF